ncbi:MAG: (d)CMP kinase [Parcubacteria group bacterium]|jgi:cytidylate kinase
MKSNIFIISFNGQEGSGKSTIAKMVAEKLNIPRYYMGQIFRDKAQKKGVTLVAFRKLLKENPALEKEIDDYMITLAEKEKSFVIEGRTAWHLLPNSLKIYLKVDPDAAAERIFKALSEAHNRGNEDSNLDTVENIQQSILRRRKDDSERYFNLYNIHQDDESNYDFVIDTTNLSIEEVFGKVMEFVESKK